MDAMYEEFALKDKNQEAEKEESPSNSHHRAWLRSVSRLSMKRQLGRKESVSKQGRKNAKPKLTLDDSTFDDLNVDHGMDYMDTEEPVNEGRLSKGTEELNVTHDIEVLEKGGSNEEPVSVADEDIFLDDALVMLSDKTKMKEVAIKEVKEFDRPERSILTLKPLPSIDPKDKGRGILKESPVKKVKRSDLDAAQIAKDAEVARLVYEEELAELKKEKEEKQRQEQASVDYIANLYDEALYIKEQERAADFVPIGSEKDEKMIEKMNKKASGVDEEEVLEEPDNTKVKKSKRQKTNSDLEEEEQLKAFLVIVPDEEGEINYEVLDKRVFRADGSSRYIKTFTEMVSRFDRLDFIELHSLVMKIFETSIPEGIDLIF
ncbi:hypothetical protein Tco_1235575 [Tanacetum coccineum]